MRYKETELEEAKLKAKAHQLADYKDKIYYYLELEVAQLIYKVVFVIVSLKLTITIRALARAQPL